ncbi:unnamed protein product, partial [Discosporangium mesarthrocarpum]
MFDDEREWGDMSKADDDGGEGGGNEDDLFALLSRPPPPQNLSDRLGEDGPYGRMPDSMASDSHNDDDDDNHLRGRGKKGLAGRGGIRDPNRTSPGGPWPGAKGVPGGGRRRSAVPTTAGNR